MNNCFSKFTIQIWICRRSVCELGWTSAHYPGSKHKGPEGYTPINKTVGRGRRGVDGHRSGFERESCLCENAG